ncbi:hypothetical protein [Archangium violaceum]|uniref:hypothetical protein n=1 Tax=Archangium violaceum TaxID=83451 RepID=UPI001F1A8F0C|nr:hypothetical protein [Archangium violaceum]
MRAQHPHARPEHLERSSRPLGHASTRQASSSCVSGTRLFDRTEDGFAATAVGDELAETAARLE